MLETCYIDDLQIHGTATYGVTSVSLGAPAPRVVAESKPSDHGAVDATNYYGPRSIEVTGRILAPTMADLWAAVDNLKGKLALGSYHTFKFRRQGLTFDEQASVRVDSPVEIPLGLMPNPFVEWGVSLFSADPRLYSAIENTGSYDPTDSGSSGLDFPLIFPLDFDSSSSTGRLEVDNEGNVDTPPTFVISGPVTNPIIDNETSGLSIYTQDCALTSSDFLTIDVANRTCVLNGSTSRPDLIDSSLTYWFNLVAGVNQLRLRGSGMSTGSTQLEVTYRSARI